MKQEEKQIKLKKIDIEIFNYIQRKWIEEGHREGGTREVQLGYEDIAKAIGIKRLTAIIHVKRLISVGLITRFLTYSNSVGRKKNRYVVCK